MTIRNALLGAGAAAFMAGVAQADTLRFAIGWPPNTIATAAVEHYAKVAGEASGGALDVKVYPLSLLNFAEATGGVRDGIADIATVLTPYFLAEFPTSNFLNELGALTTLDPEPSAKAPMALVGALTEMHLMHCPSCDREFAAQNHLFTAAATTPQYILQCMVPIRTVEDLQGKRIRAGGAFWARWAEAMGATGVSMSVNETFEGLSQGVLDCTANSGSDLTNFSFIDVVKFLNLDVPGSTFSSSIASVNREVYQGLPAEQREALMRAAAALAAHMTWNYWEEAQRNVERSRERGIEIVESSPELIAKSRAFVAQDIENLAASYKERFGLEGGDEMIAKMKELLAKWKPLAEQANTADEMAEIYWNEIYSKIDMAKFGM